MAGPIDGLPQPPADLSAQPLPRMRLRAGTILWRIHPSAHGPMWFGPAKGGPPAYRFDDPKGVYGVCYLGRYSLAAFVETFLRDLPARALSRTYLATRALSECKLTEDVWLIRAFGRGLVQLGATAAMERREGSRWVVQSFAKLVASAARSSTEARGNRVPFQP